MSTSGKIFLVPLNNVEEGILLMDQKHFPRPWKSADWYSLNPLHHLLFSWQEQNQLAGFILFNALAGDDSAHLLKICLDPQWRGLGVARTFWDYLLPELKSRGIKSVFLEVEQTNIVAIGFYQKLGFKNLRLIKGYYSDGVGAWTMSLTL